jgi:phage protein U
MLRAATARFCLALVVLTGGWEEGTWVVSGLKTVKTIFSEAGCKNNKHDYKLRYRRCYLCLFVICSFPISNYFTPLSTKHS